MEPNLTTATLKFGTTTVRLPAIEIPLNEQTIENAVDIQTLDFNVYTDFINKKRVWSFSWSFTTKAEYDAIIAVYNSQFTLFKYPTLSIPFYGYTDIPVRMSINNKNIVNVNGDVEGLEITLRETAQV